MINIRKIIIICAILLLFGYSSKSQNYSAKSTLTGTKSKIEESADNNIPIKGGVQKVIIVYKTHFDIGYSETVQQVVHDYRTSMCDRVLEVIDKNKNQPKEKQFVWTISGWPMKQILWEGQSPERKRKIEQAIRDGNLAIHAFPFTMHTELSDPEDLVRGLNISSTLLRKYGQPLSISAKMSDVPGESWILPTLFAHAGIKFYHMDDFATLILKEDLSKIPVVRTDIGDVWIHGTMSMPESTKLAQNIRPSIAGMEELSTLETIWGIYHPDQRKITAEAYEKSLLYSEHTWGLANQHYMQVPYGKTWQDLWEKGLPPQFKLIEESWKDHANYINSVEKLVAGPYQDAVASLADNVQVDGSRIVVYNPLPWKRDGSVNLDTRLIFGDDFTSLKPADGGPAIPVSREYPSIEDKAPMSRFVAKDIPALGYRTYIASKEPVEVPGMIADSNAGVIESPFFKATIDAKHGRISSLIDKRSGKEMVDTNAPKGFGQYFYERFGYKDIADWIGKSLYPNYNAHKLIFAAYDMPKESTYSSALPENMVLTVEKSAIDVKGVLTGAIPGPGQPQKISITLVLSGTNPTADFDVSWQKQPDSWPEAAWICLPFKCENPAYRLGRMGADVDPVKDMITDNANYHMWWVNTGVAVYDKISGKGFGICSPDAPVVSIGEPGEYKFDKQSKPTNPYVYVNLYNNHWRTNFAAWIGNGQRMSARVRIWSFDKFASESSLYTPAMETRIPLQVACSKVKNGQLAVSQQGISLSRKGVSLTAFGPNPDGQGTVIRFWEQGGIPGKLEINLPAGSKFTTAMPVNLRGEKRGEPIRITNGRLAFDLHSYAPASFILN